MFTDHNSCKRLREELSESPPTFRDTLHFLRACAASCWFHSFISTARQWFVPDLKSVIKYLAAFP
jgi:hypothetical protein